MASGKQLAESNFNAFLSWVSSKSDADFREMVTRGVLSRKEIAVECAFAKSALDQNPRIKAALRDLEERLRERGVLPPIVAQDGQTPASPLVREQGQTRAALDADRVRRLEQENAVLKAEVAELKRLLERFVVLQDVLAETGRLPR